MTDDCYTLSNIKSTSFWYNQSPQAGTELTEESQIVTITITNPCGKSNTITVNVHKSADIPAMVLTSTPNHFCAQTFEKAGDGTITVIAPTSGSGHAYTYKIFDANDNELSIPNFPITLTQYWLSHQTYRVQAYESTTGCSVSDTITVSHNPYSVDFSFMITPNTACSSVTGNGSITVTNPTSTNPNPDFTYSIDGVHFTTVPVFNNLMDGTYSVYVKDVTSECVAEKFVSVTDSCVPVIPAGDAQPCPGMPTVSDVDGNVYNTVQIGGQCWMKENLRTTKYADGTVIPKGNSSSITEGRWSYPNSDTSNKQAYGLLYNWKAVMRNESSSHAIPSGVQGICPTGWHVPSNEEWTILIDYVSCQNGYLCGNNSTYIAKSVASTTGWNNSSGFTFCTIGNDQDNNNATGFSALPAGRGYIGSNYNFGTSTYFWSSTERDRVSIYRSSLSCFSASMDCSSEDRVYRFSVRCLRDEDDISLLPTITTDSATTLSTTAICYSTITSEGGASVTARGVCWSTKHYPTTQDNHSNNGAGAGNYNSNISGLLPNFTYYVRAYATNLYGTVYGEEICVTIPINSNGDSYSCPGVPVLADIDGNVYNTVQIGGQCWMRENLRTTQYADGTAIPQGSYVSDTIAYWYYPNGDPTYKQSYGLLYNWSAVMYGTTSSDATPSGVQGICPNGWHVPSRAEWNQLRDYVSSQYQYVCGEDSSSIAKALSATVGWDHDDYDYTYYDYICSVGNYPNDNNATLFGALSAGTYRWVSPNYDFFGMCSRCQIWSSNEYGSYFAWYCGWYNSSKNVSQGWTEKHAANSVRCLRDEESSQFFPSVNTTSISNLTSSAVSCSYIVTSTENVSEHGVCWSSAHNPTIDDYHTSDGGGIGSFTSSISGLLSNLTYFVRSYATTSYGTVYGSELCFTTPMNSNGDEFSCPGTPKLTDVDGNVYNTVQIGDQCWMRENLRATKYANGNSIAHGTYQSSTIGYWYYPNGVSTYKQSYGLLYNWIAIMHSSTSSDASPSGIQGICPAGWHLPSDSEWTKLTDFMKSNNQYWCGNNSNYIAKALAATIGWNKSNYSCYIGNEQSSNNVTRFGALPAGRYQSPYSSQFGIEARFWSATEDVSTGNARLCEVGSADVTHYAHDKRFGYSVRCLRDETSTVIIDEKSCPNTPTVTDHEGNVYATVQIGDQCWMRENLRATKYSDDTIILQGGDTSSVIGYWYYPNNYESNKFTYGLLYNWKAVMRNTLSSNSNQSGVQGVCPNGWHVPSHAEYLQLIDYLGSQNQYFCGNAPTSIAKALASTTGWNSSTYFCVVGNNQSSNNSTGFSAFPAGEYKGDEYADFGKGTRLWSTTECTSKRPYFLSIWYHNDNVIEPADHMYFAFSVRCIRDESYTLPTITTTAVSGVSYNTATCGGTITSIGSETVTARGTCWSKSHYPTIHDDHSLDGSGSGSFTSQLINLTPMTTYYVRAYAASNAGTAYGDVKSFVTKANSVPTDDAHPCAATPIVIDVDNNVYNTVQLGGQCWMAENLRTTKFPDGTSIEYGLSNSSTIPYLYYPDGNVANVLTYGYLYNWSAVMYGSSSSNATNGGVQGICPEGWHVPSNAEWTQLINYVSGQSQYVCDSDNTCNAKALASITGWYSSSLACAVGNTLCANNVTGFGALPAGYYSGGYYNSGYSAYFWSATGNSSNDAWHCSLYYGRTDVSYSYYDKSHGFSVRCLRDEIPHEAPTVSSLPYSTNFYDDTTWTLNNGACGNYWETNSTYGLFVTNDGTTPGYIETQASTVMAEKLLLMPSSDSIHIEFDVRVGGESSYDYLKVFLSPSSTTYTAGTSHNTQSDKSYSTYAVNFSSFKFQTGNSSNPYTFNLTNGTTVHISVNMANPNPNDTAKLVFLWRDDTSVSTQPGAVVSLLSVSEVTTTVIDSKSCPITPTVTDHEGNVYATVQIGDQCWMRDNLRTTTSPSTGTYLIPSASTGYTYTGKQARWYNNDSATYAPINYGLLYNWNAAVDTFNTAYGETSVNSSSSNAVSVSFTGYRRGICPVGWHLPSGAEWTQLTNYVESQNEYVCGTNSIVKALADSVGWNSYSGTCCVGNNQSTNNATGFSAVPAGNHGGSSFNLSGSNAFFWSSTEYSSSDAYYRYLYYNNAHVYSSNRNKSNGYSVRCLRD